MWEMCNFAKELMKKNEIQKNQHSIVLYQNEDSNVCVNVYYRNETFWLTQKAMAELFGEGTRGQAPVPRQK